MLTESLNLLQNTVNLIDEVKGKHGVEVSQNKKVLARNPGLEEMSGENIEVLYCPKDIASFKCAPVVSCDVERSFSAYKD